MDEKLTFEIMSIISQLEEDELRTIKLLAKKMLDGKVKYGKWEAQKDTRNYVKEASEELLDACNYLAMQMIKQSKTNT